MGRHTLVLLALVGLAGTATAGTPMKRGSMVFLFFAAGKSSAGFEKDVIEKMQADHIGNMRKRYEEGVLKLAGPCADPDKKRRGIVMLAVDKLVDVPKHFVEDPYVQHGILTIEPTLVEAKLMDLGTPEDTGIDQHTIAVFEAAAGREGRKASAARYAKLAAGERPAIAAVAKGSGTLRMVLIFREKDVDKVKPLVESDPAVVRGDLKVGVWKQWLGKGSLAEAKQR